MTFEAVTNPVRTRDQKQGTRALINRTDQFFEIIYKCFIALMAVTIMVQHAYQMVRSDTKYISGHNAFLLSRFQGLVLDPLRAGIAMAADIVLLIRLKVPFKPFDVAVAFE